MQTNRSTWWFMFLNTKLFNSIIELLAVSMYKSFLSVKFGLGHFCLKFFLNLAMSQTFSKKKITSGKFNTCNFFENEKFSISKKNTSVGSKHQSNPTLVFFFEMKFFSFQKNLQVLN